MELTLRQAEELLIEWAAMDRSRDDRVRTAAESGVRPGRITELTGLARTTVYRILNPADET